MVQQQHESAAGRAAGLAALILSPFRGGVASLPRSPFSNVRSLLSFLEKRFDEDVLIPVPRGEKRPLHPHKDRAWGAAESLAWLAEPQTISGVRDGAIDVGLLLKELCVVDVDSREAAERLELEYPVLHDAPCQRTRKGFHYFFLRSALADAEGFFDARSPRIPGVDFKTVTRTGTRGLLMVAPSLGKEWVRPPWDVDVKAIPDALLRAVAAPCHRRASAVFVFVNAGGAELAVEDSRWPAHMSYVEPLLDTGGEVLLGDSASTAAARVPMPVGSPELLADLLAVCDGRAGLRCLASGPELLQLADFLGLPQRFVAALVPPFGALHVLHDLASVDDAWGEAALLEMRERNGVEPVQLVRLDAEAALAHRSAEGAGWSDCPCGDSRFLFPECFYRDRTQLRFWPPAARSQPAILRRVISRYQQSCGSVETRSSEQETDRAMDGCSGRDSFFCRPRLSDDPESAAWVNLPESITNILLSHPGRVVLAGGAALQAVVSGIRPDDAMDYDFFVLAESAEQGDETLASVLRTAGITTLAAAVTGCAVTFLLDGYTVQVVLRLHASLADVLGAFDLPVCKVLVVAARDGDAALEVYCGRMFLPCVARGAFWVDVSDPRFWTRASAYRIVKYVAKGFRAFVPCCQRQAMRQLEVERATDGLALLYRIEGELPLVNGTTEVPTPADVRTYAKFVAKRDLKLHTADYAMGHKIAGTLSALLRNVLSMFMRGKARPAAATGAAASKPVCWRRAADGPFRPAPMRLRCLFDTEAMMA